jgi:hypothetical protein
MAKIDRKKLNAVLSGDTCQATVGNNRTVYRVKDAAPADKPTIVGALHGHEIVKVAQDLRTIILDPRGYRTVTTRQAMRDFVEAITGTPCRVSFAGGKFTAHIGGKDFAEHVLDADDSADMAGVIFASY